ncbi:carbohydrate ABC transporter permease [Phaeovulum vinaykumarii]|uniref:Carbohydrate ABC transporter membrane protein 2, CUT1 family n=1 Tax=Phaeovulum vinaykumarii TaxID=407234 RepID=A0A1N7LK56_9RHOB|nr:carbohydrate ABC transporter permease [Phaeovulum vinaykumarii]SIS74131.1 carbohydrate ABC transporter membrane protein 2, CUT1 family [Phaeovulum vinaykumarii]SOC04894.1 carbohydrate ABC transporter membrane protein 2 (CUT1 family) [Phaeovulum vinaykumarii]
MTLLHRLEPLLALALAVLWISPLAFAFWAAFHASTDAVNFNLAAPWTLENFRTAWQGAPWLRYFLNSVILVTTVLIGQFVLTTLAGFAFAQVEFRGKDVVFVLVLLQLFILPEVLIVENYKIATQLGLLDTILGIGAPYMASAFGIFLMRQAFKSVPKELDEAARIEGCSLMGVLWRVYVPAARPTYLAYALVSVSTHWNNFLWPLVVTNNASARPLTVGLSIFGAPENGVDISVISASTMMVIAPLLILFLAFQRQFVQAFLRAGIK